MWRRRMSERARVIGLLLIVAFALPIATGSSASATRERFVLDSTGSTYPFVMRLEGTISRTSNSLRITVERGLVRSAIPEDVGTEGLASDIQIAMGLGRSIENGWTMDIEAPQQFIAMRLAPGGTQLVSRR